MIVADLAVLGGGPAGAAAAITAATNGLRVVLCERADFPRLVPGETAHPGIQSLLRQLGVEDEVLSAGFLRCPGHLVRRMHSEQFQPYGSDDDGPWLGFQLWRPTFDQILLNRARSAAVEILQPCRILKVIRRENRIQGVETDKGPIHASCTIDATGRRRLLTHEFPLPWHPHGPPRRAWYGHARGACSARAEFPALTIDASGWEWVACVRPDTFAWVRMNFDASRPPDGWMPFELRGLESLGPATGADVTWAVSGAPAGPGYFLVGDAACILDPAAGHGLLKAIMTGIQAAHLAINVHARRIGPAQANVFYSAWLFDWFKRDTEALTELIHTQQN